MKKRIINLMLIGCALLSLNSCWPVLVGAGATGGYMARDAGYEVQSPVTKE